ncbi:MAG: ABC transporter permease [Pseudomonadota bacterium]
MSKISRLFVLGLRLLAARPAPGLIILFGVAGLVAVSTSLTAIASAFQATFDNTGDADRAIILRAGSTSQINGNIPLLQHDVVKHFPEIARQDGVPQISRETYVSVRMPLHNGEDASLPLRGVGAVTYQVRSEVNIVAGRELIPGKYELLIGDRAAAMFVGFELGAEVRIRGQAWTVVGVFAAQDRTVASEAWVDERLLAQTWGRGETFSTMLVRLTSADAFVALQTRISDDRRLTLSAYNERAFYRNLSAGTTGLITGIGWLVGVVMALGALVAAFNTMQTALQMRTREMAVLRALGFDRGSILLAVLLECALLSLCGAGLALLCVYVLLDGEMLSTVAATTTSGARVAFRFDLTSAAIWQALCLGCGVGVLGGWLPGWQAVRRWLPGALKGV